MNSILDRVLLARPLALVAGAMAAALVYPALRGGGFLIYMGGGFGAIALAIYLLSRLRLFRRMASLASPVVSALGWGSYATLTGSLESPFIAVFFLEIAVAAIAMGPRGVIWVTSCCLAVLALMRVPFQLLEAWQLHLLESLFILGAGVLGAAISKRRQAGDVALKTQGQELGGRLEIIQRELDDERVVSRVGENVARLAHGLKNTVHSLSGFVSLIEPQLDSGKGTNAALVGLRSAIEDLEKLARMTLADEAEAVDSEPSKPLDPSRAAFISVVVEKARIELCSANPGVRWEICEDEGVAGLAVPIGESTLLELLVILMRNGIEAMSGEGEGRVTMRRREGRCEVSVEDEGAGLEPEDLTQIFQPGYTTKAKGSGFGLFLARRIVEGVGGTLELCAGKTRGAVVRVELPICSAE
jgi:signal transduction histidine kinase